MENQEVDILLRKFVANQLTREQERFLTNWLLNPDNNSKAYNIIRNHWEDFSAESNDTSFDVESMLDKVHHKINLKRDSVALSEVKQENKIKWLSVIQKAAAILILPIIAFNIFYFIHNHKPENKNWHEVTTAQGVRHNLTLADGTKVWLNSGSTLRFPDNFEGNERIIELKGEAFFDVAKNKFKPFKVQTRDMVITALGTKFNVYTYPNDRLAQTTLLEGKVNVELNNKSKSFILNPDEMAVYSKETNELRKTSTNANTSIAWIKGKLIFKNMRLDEVVQRLSNHCNIDIALKDKELEKFTYTATFTDENINQILDLLKLAAPIGYKYYKPVQNKNNEFTKQRIEIYLLKH
jgi:ferric-dicitrate binding protein FerR (iron transport regulator)